MFKKEARELFRKGKRSDSVRKFYEAAHEEAKANGDAAKLGQICAIIKEKTIQLFAISLEAAHLLNLPAGDFYDLYFKGSETNPANLLRGMHAEGMIKIIEYFGYSIQFVKSTDSVCQIAYTLDEGTEVTYTLTMEEAKNNPYIQEEFLDEDSPWHSDPKGMLVHEAVKFVAKTSYKRLFKVKATNLVNEIDDNEQLAEEIFNSEIFDIEIEDFEYRSVIAKNKNKPRDLEIYIVHLRERCINRIRSSLDLCDTLGLPKDLFYDISKESAYPKKNPLLNIRSCCIIDVLRELGHIIQVQEATSKSCTLKFEKDGIERTEQVVLENLKRSKNSVKEALNNPESVWSKHTTTLLMYEVLAKVLKTDFAESSGAKEQVSRESIRKLLFTRSKEPSRFFFEKTEEKELEEIESIEEEKETQKEPTHFIIPDLSRLKKLHDLITQGA